MNIKYVTFTGVDNWTDLDELERIQQQYPYAEFGVLASYHWSENGPRFPEPSVFDNLKGRKLNLSLHLCGSLAIKCVQHDFEPAIALLGDNFNLFKRVQLNMHLNQATPEQLAALTLKDSLEQIIVQMHQPDLCRTFLAAGHHSPNLCYLLDSSGGAGIDTPIDIVSQPGIEVGYAGGMGVSNVWSKLKTLLQHESGSVFWIDMETKVRTHEILDLELVKQVLALCDVLIRKYNGKAQ
jgi:hypothetical protein